MLGLVLEFECEGRDALAFFLRLRFPNKIHERVDDTSNDWSVFSTFYLLSYLGYRPDVLFVKGPKIKAQLVSWCGLALSVVLFRE